MPNRLMHLIPHYFQQPPGRQLEELYIAVGLQDLALAAMIIFEPIFLHQLGYSIAQIALYYSLVYFLYIFFIPLGGKMVARYGAPRSIALGTFFLVVYYVVFLQIRIVPTIFWVAPIIFALQKSFYWPGYHADFVTTSSQNQRGKEFSGMLAISALMYIIGPILGGLLVKMFGYAALFSFGAVVLMLSNVALFVDRVPVRRQPFSYWESFRLPWTRQHRRTTLAYFGYAEQLVGMYLWPIFLVITFKTALSLGTVIAATTFLTTLITLIIGRLVDRGQWRPTFRTGGVLAVINWLIRPILRSGPWLFVSDTLGKISGSLTWVTGSEVAYERAIKENDPIRRGMILEQGLSYGKLLIGLLIAFFSLWFPPFTTAFMLAGLFSLLFLAFR